MGEIGRCVSYGLLSLSVCPSSSKQVSLGRSTGRKAKPGVRISRADLELNLLLLKTPRSRLGNVFIFYLAEMASITNCASSVRSVKTTHKKSTLQS